MRRVGVDICGYRFLENISPGDTIASLKIKWRARLESFQRICRDRPEALVELVDRLCPKELHFTNITGSTGSEYVRQDEEGEISAIANDIAKHIIQSKIVENLQFVFNRMFLDDQKLIPQQDGTLSVTMKERFSSIPHEIRQAILIRAMTTENCTPEILQSQLHGFQFRADTLFGAKADIAEIAKPKLLVCGGSRNPAAAIFVRIEPQAPLQAICDWINTEERQVVVQLRPSPDGSGPAILINGVCKERVIAKLRGQYDVSAIVTVTVPTPTTLAASPGSVGMFTAPSATPAASGAPGVVGGGAAPPQTTTREACFKTLGM